MAAVKNGLRENNRGPRIDPCGTPDVRAFKFDRGNTVE